MKAPRMKGLRWAVVVSVASVVVAGFLVGFAESQPSEDVGPSMANLPADVPMLDEHGKVVGTVSKRCLDFNPNRATPADCPAEMGFGAEPVEEIERGTSSNGVVTERTTNDQGTTTRTYQVDPPSGP